MTRNFHYGYDGFKMKLFTARKFQNAQKGFTLIELLVVIGILGILAAALVATIDPFEQLRKATDSRSQNTAVELHGALIRYYTTHEAMPWENGACDASALDPGGGLTPDIAAGSTVAELDTAGCLDVLIAEGELKQAFTTAQGLDQIVVVEPYIVTGTTPAVDGSPAICYLPESRSGRADDNARYLNTGVIDAVNCPSTTPGACYWCAQ